MTDVTLVNLNRVQVPAIGPYALDVLGSALEDNGHDVEVLDLTPVDNPEASIDNYFSRSKPDLVALTLRNTFDVYFPSFLDLPNKGSFLSEHQRLILKVQQHVPNQRLVIGGVGFSVAPEQLMRRFGLKYGVRGPGERKIVDLADRIEETGRISVKETEFFDGRGDTPQKRVFRKFFDNVWYYENGGLGNLRTSNGCSMPCGYCPEPSAKGRSFQRRTVEDVIFELDQLVEQGVLDIHTADSEFNLPINHSKNVLRAIIDRGYGQELRLWVYCQPKPFDAEYAELLAAANVKGVNFGTDHVDEVMLKNLGKWYRAEDIQRATELCKSNGIKVMHELLFGYPGDSPEKMYQAIDFMRNLDPWVTGVTVGIGVLPGTSLGVEYQKRKSSGNLEGFYIHGEPLVDPTFFVDPSFRIPEIFEQVREHVGSDIYRMMIPTTQSTSTENNQLINSVRLKQQLELGLRGTYWPHYRAAQ